MSSLELVNLVDVDFKPIDGLVSTHDHALAETLDERAVLFQAQAFEHIHFVLFRRFKDSFGKHLRSSQVAAYVVDNSKTHLSEQTLLSSIMSCGFTVQHH